LGIEYGTPTQNVLRRQTKSIKEADRSGQLALLVER
jgi:hypothetical protein